MQKSQNTVEIKVFLNFLLVDGGLRIQTINKESGSGNHKNVQVLRNRNTDTAIKNSWSGKKWKEYRRQRCSVLW